MWGVGALRLPCCFAHGREDAKGLSTCRGEPVRPGDLEQHQSLQFKFAIDVFLRFILWRGMHSVSGSFTGRKLLQSGEMRCGDEHVALPFLFTRTLSDSEGSSLRRSSPGGVKGSGALTSVKGVWVRGACEICSRVSSKPTFSSEESQY